MLCRLNLPLEPCTCLASSRMQVLNKGTTWQGPQSACGLRGSVHHPACALSLISPPHLLVPCRL